MATFATSQEWLNQCSLLLEARPQTTKITSRYSVKPKPARRVKKSAATADGETLPDAPKQQPASHTSQNPRAKLVLKAIDPASGVCLRYETTKAAEVSRLVQLLGQLGRRQAGLAAAAAAAQETAEDVAMTEAEPAVASSSAPATTSQSQTATPAAPAPQQQQQQQAGGGGGGKGKKKKGKR